MGKEYNVDDILTEVKKRRKEQEQELRANATQASADNTEKPTISDKKTEETPKSDNKAEETPKSDKKTEETPKSDKKTEETPKPDKKTEETPKPDKKTEETPKPDKKTEETPKSDKKTEETPKSDNKAEEAPKSDNKTEEATNTDKEAEETTNSDNTPDSEDGMVDLLNFTVQEVTPQTGEEEEKVKFFSTKKGKIAKTVIIILVILIVIAGIAAAIFIDKIAGRVSDDEPEPYEKVTYYDGIDFLQENFPLIEEASGYDIYSYKQYLKDWYMNGDPVRSSHVINVLLIGEDTREENISEVSRADSAIIASVNIDTGSIHLTSILRDLYVYYQIDGEDRYGKINESASEGGIATYIETLQRTYKIAIDGYAIVNFASFPKIIDALGGVEILITDAEINEINNHPYRYGDAGDVYIEKAFDGSEGIMKLDGLQALAFCRIRKIDSDNARADRQKTVLTEIFNMTKDAGTLDTVKVVNQLSQYVKTSYSKKEIIALGNTAVRDNWLDYEMLTTNIPAEENCAGGEHFSASPNNWIWIADIPKDAYETQTMIYGKSNIKLNENRADYIALGR